MDFPNELLLHNFQIRTLKVHKNIQNSSRSYYSKAAVRASITSKICAVRLSLLISQRIFLRKPVMTVIIGDLKTKCSKQ